MKHKFLSILSLIALGQCLPALAAERLVVSYGLLQRSVPVSAVKTFIEVGKITPELKPYATLLNSEELKNLRTSLQSEVKVGIVPLSDFLGSPLGQQLLGQVGKIIRVSPETSGEKAVSSALVLSLTQPDGLNLVNFLEAFPTQQIWVDGLLLRKAVAQVEQLVAEARNVGLQTGVDASLPPPSVKGIKAPSIVGPYGVQPLTLKHSERPLTTAVWLTKAKGKRPILILSHGLGEDRNTYDYLGKHWASYGFNVFAPDHPGSDQKRLQALLDGRYNDVIPPNEFIERPKDITRLINRLELLNKKDPRFRNRLNLGSIGIFGHSFGGYTALALAGAPLDPSYLQKVCAVEPEKSLVVNIAFFFQCQAQTLGSSPINLQDKRIKAVIASSAPSGSVFGNGLNQIKIPTLTVTETDDRVAPSLAEQVQPFNLLKTPKYLLTLVGGTHFSVGASRPANPDLPNFGTSDATARNALQAVGLAFWETHLGVDPRYKGYLVPGYGPVLSKAQGITVRLIAEP